MVLKVMVLVGAALAVFGFILVMMHFRREDQNITGRSLGIIGAISWAASGRSALKNTHI